MSEKFLILLITLAIISAATFAGAAEPSVISPGDTIRITVLDEPDHSRQVVVDSNGYIALPLVKEIHVAGLSTIEAASVIAQSLNKYLKNPNVMVEMVEKARRSVTITGQVRTPGVYQLQPSTRLMEAIGLAGGLSGTADTSRVSVTRRGSAEPIICDLKQFLEGTLESANIILEDGDVILVPESNPTVGVVFVYGAVRLPGQPIQIREGMRVSQAISAAGGLIFEQADITKATLKREGQNETVQIDLGKALTNDTTADVLLQPGDTITVPLLEQGGSYTIFGAVNNSGEFPIKGKMTISKAIAAAGTSGRSKLSALKLTRTAPDGKPQSMVIDLNKITSGKSQDVALQSGDTIYVPERGERFDKGRLLAIGITLLSIFLR